MYSRKKETQRTRMEDYFQAIVLQVKGFRKGMLSVRISTRKAYLKMGGWKLGKKDLMEISVVFY